MSSGISLASNIASLKVQRQLGVSSELTNDMFQKLSSGQRITKASDDAAGLAIASSLRTDTRVFTQAVRNINDGISAISIAQAAGLELSGVLTRIQELATQSANGSYSQAQRTAINTEAQALRSEFNRVIDTASFNGIKLLDGTFSNVRIQTGKNEVAAQNLEIQVGSSGLARTVIHSGTWETVKGYSLQTGGYGGGYVITSDLNNDGKVDVVSTRAGPGEDNLAVFLGNGDGTFLTPKFLNGGTNLHYAVGVDADNDNDVDLVSSFGTSVVVFMNNGDGSYLAAISYASQGEVIGGADFTGDGIEDLVLGRAADGLVSLMTGNSNGSFNAAVSIQLSAASGYGVFEDINDDGKLDMINNYSNANRVMLGNGNGTFLAAVVYANGTGYYNLADINNDGKKDLITTGNSGYLVRLGTANGTFGAQVSIPSASSVGAVMFDDLDKNGNMDLVLGISSPYTNGTGTIHMGNGDGTFTYRSSFTAGSNGGGISRLVDLNNDGVKDVVSGGYFTASVEVVLGVPSYLPKLEQFSLSTQSAALSALTAMKTAQEYLSSQLGQIGAQQSRLLSARSTIASTRDNYASAGSRIMDLDVATGSAELVRQKILQNVGSAVLAQANQAPSLALQLLRG